MNMDIMSYTKERSIMKKMSAVMVAVAFALCATYAAAQAPAKAPEATKPAAVKTMEASKAAETT